MSYELLNELGYYDLENRTNRLMGDGRKTRSNRATIHGMTFIPMTEAGDLKVTAKTSTGNQQYDTTILFDDVNYVNDEELENHDDVVKFVGADGDEFTMVKVLPAANVKVNCTCDDFKFRFAIWDHRHKALDGEPPPRYVRKTTTYPEVNPFQTPGVCKHIIALADALQSKGIYR